MVDLIQKEAHKELHKRIYDCNCKPYLRPNEYCEKCKNAVLEFMKEHGAGGLTRDVELEELTKQYSRICKENALLLKKLEIKSRRVEELKKENEELGKR